MGAFTRVLLQAWNSRFNREENIRSSHNGLKTSTVIQERIDSGNAVTHSDEHVVAVGSHMNHVINPPFEMHLMAYDFIADNGPAQVRLFEAPFIDTNSMGEFEGAMNANRNFSDPASLGVFINPFIDVNSMGARLSLTNIPVAAAGPVKTVEGKGGTIIDEWELKAETYYLINYVNSSTEVAIVNPKFIGYNPNGG